MASIPVPRAVMPGTNAGRVWRASAAVLLALTALALAACTGDSGSATGSSAPAGGEGDSGAPAVAAEVAAMVVVEAATLGAHGEVLTDAEGLTLYTFTADTPGSGESTCYDACATAWPPALAGTATLAAHAGIPGELATITRDDGTFQVTYNGWPLYLFQRDAGPGDAAGQGITSFGGTWVVASTGAAQGAAPAASPTPAAATEYY